MSEHPSIHEAMAAVFAAVGAVGKGGRNKEQGYAFRSIDDLYGEIHEAMAEHGVFVTPHVVDRHDEPATSKGGAHGYRVVLTLRFEFRCGTDPDGCVVAVVSCEGIDYGDKASAKAATSGLKYALIQTFMIPLEGQPDADSSSHDLTREQTAGERLGWDSDVVMTEAHDEVAAKAKKVPEDQREALREFKRVEWPTSAERLGELEQMIDEALA